MKENPSAAKNIRKKINRELLIGAGVFILLLIMIFILNWMSIKQIPKITLLKQDLANTQLSNDTQRALDDYIKKNKDDLVLVDSFIPNKEAMVTFIQELEALTQKYDEAARVKFITQTPKKVLNDQILPLHIQMNTSVINFLEFLKEFERLPYILEIQTLELNNLNDVNKVSSIDIGVVLYVQDPFN